MGERLKTTRLACNLAEAAEMLSVAESTVRKLCASGTLPSAKLGGCRRILIEDVLKLFRARQAGKVAQ